MPKTDERRLLFAIVLMLFGIQLTLMGGGAFGLVLDLFALLVAVSGIQNKSSS